MLNTYDKHLKYGVFLCEYFNKTLFLLKKPCYKNKALIN